MSIRQTDSPHFLKVMAAHRYMDIVTDIKEQVANGVLLPGSKIKSENELSEEYGLSRQTVRHSIAVLEEDGLVRRVKGSGTYIADNALTDRSNRKKVAVVTTYVNNYIFPQMIQHMEKVLADSGYMVQIYFTYNRISKEREILEGIIEADEVAGIIIEATKSNLPNPNLKYFEKMKQMHIPVLFINTYYEELNIPHVSINDVQAGALATEHVIEKGHTKIGGVFKLDDGQGAKRYFGFLETINKAGINISGNDIVWFDTVDIESPENIESLYERIHSRLGSRTAIVFYNDEVATKLMEAFRKHGIKVPDDISIIGIDDSVASTNEEDHITSIIFPTRDVADKAARNLLELIKNPKFDGTYEFSLELVERNSVKEII